MRCFLGLIVSFIFASITGTVKVTLAKQQTAERNTAAPPMSSEVSFAKSVVANRALCSQSIENSYQEPLAKLFAGEKLMKTKKRLKRTMKIDTGRNEVSTITSRHMIIDKIIHDAMITYSSPHGPRQIVIMGAGFESRANRFSDVWPVKKWFEIDLAAPQQHKLEILANHSIIDPDNLVRVAMNLTDVGSDWISSLEEAGWDPLVPTIYILEGLVYYMNTDQAMTLLKSIPAVPESRIIVTVVEHGLHKIFARFGVQWNTNLRMLKNAGGLQLKNYKLIGSFASHLPQRCGLKVRAVPLPLPFNTWERFCSLIHIPAECILEYEAI